MDVATIKCQKALYTYFRQYLMCLWYICVNQLSETRYFCVLWQFI